MEEEKPFACPIIDCGLQFVNEDHLTVHKKKHEMSLTLTPSVTATNSFVDQTPTPSRFLNALDTEMFADLQNDNPFDATFRKVNALGSSCQLTIPEASSLISSLPESDVLNTPSITLTSEAEVDGPPSFRHDSSSVSKTLTSEALSKDNQVVNEASESLPFTHSNQTSRTTDIGEAIVDSSCNTETDVETVQDVSSTVVQDSVKTSFNATFPASTQRENVNRINVVQTPVITSVGLPGLTARNNSASVPMAVVVTKAVTNCISTVSSTATPLSISTSEIKHINTTQPVIQTVPIPPMVHIIIRLPNGQTMPIQIPVVTTATSAPPVNTQPITSTSENFPKVSSSQSLAKMKLKALIGSQKVSSSVNGDVRSSDIPDTSVPRLQPAPVAPSQNSFDGTSQSGSPPSSPHSVQRPVSTGRRRREIEDDPDEKRRKSLERNRAAATRCRQKRKQWIDALEKKADELSRVNLLLQNEVENLRHEVAQLKTMLLAHKDCPITQQQRTSDTCETTTFHTFPVHITTQSSFTLPNISETQIQSSPQNVSIMEVEVSSSQSSYFSDGSESSVAKEC